MDASAARNFVNSLFSEKSEQLLSDTECAVFEGAWNGFSYKQIAENHGYSVEYLSKDVGFHLWQKISKVIGCDIGKKNLKSVLMQEISEPKISTTQTIVNQEVRLEGFDELVEKLRDLFEEDARRKCLQLYTVNLNYYPLNKPLEEIYVPINLKDPQFQKQNESSSESTRKEMMSWEEALLRHRKIKILGVPGGGKTTLAQFIATHYKNLEIKSSILPIFISLRKYSQTTNILGLKSCIRHILGSNQLSEQEFETLLSHGRLLFVLDGLDEVKEHHLEAVLDEISDFFDIYRDIYAVITCRKEFSAAKSLQLNEFKSFELSGFNNGQKKQFIIKWFNAAPDLTATERIMYGNLLLEELSSSENQKVDDLAEVPLLLHLICLVFRYERGLPSRLTDLYDKVIDLLLKGWNVEFKRHPYAGLNASEVKSIRDLLRKLAVRTFIEGNVLDERSLESLLRDSPLSLAELEVHSGLIRKDGWQASLYTFSHQTLQEYLTAEAFIYSGDYQGLCEHILDERWREIFLLSLQIGDPDTVIMAMKQGLDKATYSDKSLQNFQTWLCQKNDIDIYKPSAIRMFYLTFYFLVHYISIDCDYFFVDSIIDYNYVSGGISNGFENAFKIMFYLAPNIFSKTNENTNNCINLNDIDDDDFENNTFSGSYDIPLEDFNDMTEKELISKLPNELRTDYHLVAALNSLRQDSNFKKSDCTLYELSFVPHQTCHPQQLNLEFSQSQKLSQSFAFDQEFSSLIHDLNNHQLYKFHEQYKIDYEEYFKMIKPHFLGWANTLEKIIKNYRIGSLQKLTEQEEMLRNYYLSHMFLLKCVSSIEDISHNVKLKIEEDFLAVMDNTLN